MIFASPALMTTHRQVDIFRAVLANSDWIERHDLENIFVDGDAAYAASACRQEFPQYRVLRFAATMRRIDVISARPTSKESSSDSRGPGPTAIISRK